MDAMLFAAGLGTRLAPITDTLPKALVPLAGVPMLERVAERVIAAGADRLIINVHHFAADVKRFAVERGGFGVEVVFSEEPGAPLETGGGLRRAAPLFRRDAPAILHNTDIWTTFPLGAMYASHLAARPLATLAVQDRRASRYLYFDDLGLVGRANARSGAEEWARPAEGEVRRLAFCGVHVIEPALLDTAPLRREGAFSIIDAYLELAAAGHHILPFAADGWDWADIGTLERLAAAEALVARS